MSEKEKVDLRGLTCPEPVIRTKKLFDNQAVNAVEALVDDEVCVNNLTRLATSLKANASVDKENGFYRIRIERGAGAGSATSSGGANQSAGAAGVSAAVAGGGAGVGVADVSAGAAAVGVKAGSAAHSTSGTGTSTGTVVFLGKDTFGDGDPELSRMLVNLFLQTTFESGLRPRAILMANSGVKLMETGSQVLTVLNQFRDDGVEVLACGLCLDFYKMKEQVPTAQITNMFAICEYMFAADRVIQP